MDTKEDLKRRAWSVAALEHSQMTKADTEDTYASTIRMLEAALKLAKEQPNTVITCSLIMGVAREGGVEISGGLVGSAAAAGAVDIIHKENMEEPNLKLMEMAYDLIAKFRSESNTEGLSGLVRRLMSDEEPCDCDACKANRAAAERRNIKH